MWEEAKGRRDEPLENGREGWQWEGLGLHSLEVPAAAGCAAEVSDGTALSPPDARSNSHEDL